MIDVTAAGAGDMEAVARIYEAEVLHGLATFEEVAPDVAEITARWRAICAAGLPYLVARRQGSVVGYAYASAFRPRPAYRFTVESSVYVDGAARGQGVGRLLLTRLIARCEAAGWRQMVAVIGGSGNAASIGLHRAMGFDHRGVMQAVGFKHGAWVDTIVMQRALGAGSGALPD